MNGHWTADEKRILEKYYPENGVRVVAQKLGRSESSVRLKAHNSGLKVTAQGLTKIQQNNHSKKGWTLADDNFMRENYPHYGVTHCAKMLGRSTSAIDHRRKQLGLAPRGHKRSPVPPSQAHKKRTSITGFPTWGYV